MDHTAAAVAERPGARPCGHEHEGDAGARDEHNARNRDEGDARTRDEAAWAEPTEIVDLAALLSGLDAAIAGASRQVLEAELVAAASDRELLAALTVAARLQRRVEGLITELVGATDARSTRSPNAAGIAASVGCRNVSDLLRLVTLASPQAVAATLKVARTVRRPVGFASGEFLPPELPALRGALLDGAIGIDGVSAVLGPLRDLEIAVGAAVMRTAERHLAAAARGMCCPAGAVTTATATETFDGDRGCAAEDCAGEPSSPLGVRELRALAQDLVFHLDPDGAEPQDSRALRGRGITFGAPRDGLVPFSGRALVEVAAQFQRICDAMRNPKLDGPRLHPAGDARDGTSDTHSTSDTNGASDTDGASDTSDTSESGGTRELARDLTDFRTRAQKQHDVLATILTIAARSGELPTIGGATPTLVVSVTADDLASGRGFAIADGIDEPLSIHAARHIGCASVIERVGIEHGRIHSLSIHGRVFDHWQRKAIVLRDGACVIPGCGVPAGWCEIHHVTEHAKGGPTHTANGVLLCWWHHRALGTIEGWEVRMRDGAPEARPPTWHDAHRRWRPVGASRLHPPPGRTMPQRP